MATPAQIQAALAEAQGSGFLSYAQQAILVRRAVTNAILNGVGECEIPVEVGGSDGTTWGRMKLQDAVALAVRLENLDSGGVVGQLVEFSQ